MSTFVDPDSLRLWLEGLGPSAWPVFVALQIIQVLVFWIPGDLVQIAGGMVFGWGAGTLLSLFGVTIGSQVAFAIARRWGRSRSERWLAERGWTEAGRLLHHRRFDLYLGVAYLLPFVPKDAFSYLAGLSSVKPFRFFWITTLARVPGLALSSYLGVLALEGQVAPLGVFLAAGVLVAGVAFGIRQLLLKRASA